jgi:hypothetical protein
MAPPTVAVHTYGCITHYVGAAGGLLHQLQSALYSEQNARLGEEIMPVGDLVIGAASLLESAAVASRVGTKAPRPKWLSDQGDS